MLRLSDGRRLSYAEYGDPARHPLPQGLPENRRVGLAIEGEK